MDKEAMKIITFAIKDAVANPQVVAITLDWKYIDGLTYPVIQITKQT